MLMLYEYSQIAKVCFVHFIFMIHHKKYYSPEILKATDLFWDNKPVITDVVNKLQKFNCSTICVAGTLEKLWSQQRNMPTVLQGDGPSHTSLCAW